MQNAHELVYRASSVLLLVPAEMDAFAILKDHTEGQREQIVPTSAILKI